MKEIETLSSLEQFFFEVPLYASFKLDAESDELEALYRQSGVQRVDGHCPFCHRDSTFTVNGQYLHDDSSWWNINLRVAFDSASITCVRHDSHELRCYFMINKLVVQKVGQYPSIATVANDAVAKYRKFMDSLDSGEFYKAIGLAAHGVGVGSFVYLRRVFERLIYRRYAEFKDKENWKDEDFYNMRMEEKVLFLKDHLPAFLVENRRVYSILSIGIHELREQDCLVYFEAIKQRLIPLAPV